MLARAREAAGDEDVRISGGRDVLLQSLNAGLVDELQIALAPTILGEGLRRFDGIDERRVGVEIVETIHSPSVSHLRYAVKRR